MADGESGGHGGAAPAAVSEAANEATAPQVSEHQHDQHGKAAFNVTASNIFTEEYPISPGGPGRLTPMMFSRRNTTLDLDDYFEGPRDMSKHSKWPLFLQMHGSILPKMIVPLLAVAAWATLITCLEKFLPWVELGIDSVLLTVLGFVVGLGLSFRSSTAYERYADGRRCWSQLSLTCQSLGRVFWVHTNEREGVEKRDMLAKLTAMNLLVAFAVSLKHRLRFEPYTHYDDMVDLVEHLDTFAREATQEDVFLPKKPGFFKAVGEHLGLSFATSNPRKTIKRAENPLGNLPLEILCYLSAYVDETIGNGQLPIGMTQTFAYNGIFALNDVLTNTERVLNTPLPLAYTIAISQITWVYVMLLPFQLLSKLSWITIPACIAAAYIILGILFIGREIENPFGQDVNDLPLERFCQEIVCDMETIAARPKPRSAQWIESSRNKVFFAHSDSSYKVWESRPENTIRSALRNRPHTGFQKQTKKDGSTSDSEKGDQNV